MISLETAYAVLNTSLPKLSQEKWVSLLSINPRHLFGLDQITIQEGAKAVMTLFDPQAKWIVTEKDLRSRSKNSAFIGKELTGKVLGIVNETKSVILNS
jgi:dihydroorotase